MNYIILILPYKEIRDYNDNLINLSFINYINNNNEENKNLLLLTFINNNHYNLAFYNNTNIDYNYKPVLHFINNINNENIINKTEINNSNKNFSIESNINIIENKNIRIFADISNLGLQDILNIYDYELKGEDNLADIYYYIYHYMLSGNKEGKYSSNFIDKNKNSKNIRYAK